MNITFPNPTPIQDIYTEKISIIPNELYILKPFTRKEKEYKGWNVLVGNFQTDSGDIIKTSISLSTRETKFIVTNSNIIL